MYRLLDALWLAGVHYLGNLKPITVETDESVLSASVSVSAGSSVVATIPLNYTPSGGRVTIDLSDLLRPYFEFQVLAPRVRLFKQERMMLDVKVRFMGAAQPSLSFRVIRGGISGVEDNVEEWLLKNPLSWQPRRKYVMYNQPEWLTLYLRSGDVIVYTIYTNSKGATPIQAAGLSQQTTSTGVYTIDVSPAAIRKLIDIAADDYITFYKVTTTAGVEMQYVLDSAKSEEERWFFWQNSLGGMDTARFCGEEVLLINSEDKTLSRQDETHTYGVEMPARWRQNTGSISIRERVWLLDFFRSPHRYRYRNGALQAIIITESGSESSTSDNIYDYSFTYELSDDEDFLNIGILEAPPSSLPAVPSMDFPLPPHPSDLTLLSAGEGVFFAGFHNNAWGVIGYNQLLGTLQESLKGYIDKLIKDYTAWYLAQSGIQSSANTAILSSFSAQLKTLRASKDQIIGSVVDVVKVALTNADREAQASLDALRAYFVEHPFAGDTAQDLIVAVEDALGKYGKVLYIAHKSLKEHLTDQMLQQLAQMGEDCNATALGYANMAQQHAFHQAQAYTDLTAVTIDTAILSTQNLSIFIRSTEGLIIKQEPSTTLSVGVRFNGADITDEVLEMTPAVNFIWRRRTKTGVHDGMTDAEWEAYAVGRHEIVVNRALTDKIRFWLETSAADDSRIIEQFRYKRV